MLLVLCWWMGYAVQAQDIRRVKIDDLVKIIETSREPLIVNFWASWCTPCIHEIPWFEKNVAAYKDKGVKLLLVSLDFADDYPKNIRSFVQKNKYQSQVLWLDEIKSADFCPRIDKSWEGTIPVTLFINNTTHFRQFFNRQVTEPQLQLILKQLTGS